MSKKEEEQEKTISQKEQEEEEEEKNEPKCLSEITEKTPPVFVPLKLLPEMIKELTNGNDQEQYHATMCIRKLLAVEDNLPTSDIIEAGAVPLLVKQLNKMEDEKVIFEATRALTNIAASGSPSDVQAILEEEGALDLIISQLSHPSDQVREQAAWCVGNLAGDSVEVRDTLIMLDVPLILSHAIKLSEKSTAAIHNIVWAMSNLVRGKPKADAVRTKPIVGAVVGLILSSSVNDLTNALWTIAYYSELSSESADTIVQSGILQPLIERYLLVPKHYLQLPALKIIGNLAAGTEAHARVVVESGVLRAFPMLVQDFGGRGIAKESCWTVGNLLASESSSFPICQLIADAGLIPLFCQNLSVKDGSVRLESTCALQNFVARAPAELVKQAVESHGMLLEEAVKSSLNDPSAKTTALKLDLIKSILEVGDKITKKKKEGQKRKKEKQQEEKEDEGEEEQGQEQSNNYFLVGNPEMKAKLMDAVERLQSHSSQNVYRVAADIMDSYFPSE